MQENDVFSQAACVVRQRDDVHESIHYLLEIKEPRPDQYEDHLKLLELEDLEAMKEVASNQLSHTTHLSAETKNLAGLRLDILHRLPMSYL